MGSRNLVDNDTHRSLRDSSGTRGSHDSGIPEEPLLGVWEFLELLTSKTISVGACLC